MNGPTLYLYGRELDSALAGKRVRYVLETGPGAPARAFLVRFDGSPETLLIAPDNVLPSIVLLPRGMSPPGTNTPPAARLDRFLTGRTISHVQVEPVDRSISIMLEGGRSLRVDLIPRRAALYGVDEGLLQLVFPDGMGLKTGEPLPPLSGGTDLFAFESDRLPGAAVLEPEIGREELRAVLREALRTVRALPPEWIDELAVRSAGHVKGPRGAWSDMLEELRPGGGSARPAIYSRRDSIVLSPIPLGHLQQERDFDSLSEAVTAFWESRWGGHEREKHLIAIRSLIRVEGKRRKRLIKKLERDRADGEKSPLYRKYGEILSIHFGRIKRGSSKVTLPDPYGGEEIEIPLDPSKSARDNIGRWFKRSAKGERALEHIKRRVGAAEEELEVLARAENEIAEGGGEAGGAGETDEVVQVPAERLREIMRELRERFRPERPEPEWRKRIKKPKDRKIDAYPREYTIVGGYTVLVGRDNRENDRLTFKIAGQRDLWFHVSQSPGSHVVLLKNDPKENPSKEALLVAASLAAHFSKARNASKVPVIYTERRFVRKPRGAPAGQVTVSREKTLFVEPALPKED